MIQFREDYRARGRGKNRGVVGVWLAVWLGVAGAGGVKTAARCSGVVRPSGSHARLDRVEPEAELGWGASAQLGHVAPRIDQTAAGASPTLTLRRALDDRGGQPTGDGFQSHRAPRLVTRSPDGLFTARLAV